MRLYAVTNDAGTLWPQALQRGELDLLTEDVVLANPSNYKFNFSGTPCILVVPLVRGQATGVEGGDRGRVTRNGLPWGSGSSA